MSSTITTNAEGALRTESATNTNATSLSARDRQRRRRGAHVPRGARRRGRSSAARGRKPGAAGQRSADARALPPARKPDGAGRPHGILRRRWARLFRWTGGDGHLRSWSDASLLERRRRGTPMLGMGESSSQPRVLPHRGIRIDAAGPRPPESVRRGLPARPLPDGVRAGRPTGTRPRGGVPDSSRRGSTPGPGSTLRGRAPANQPLSASERGVRAQAVTASRRQT